MEFIKKKGKERRDEFNDSMMIKFPVLINNEGWEIEKDKGRKKIKERERERKRRREKEIGRKIWFDSRCWKSGSRKSRPRRWKEREEKIVAFVLFFGTDFYSKTLIGTCRERALMSKEDFFEHKNTRTEEFCSRAKY